MTGAKVVAAARGWIGTPFVHQASMRGAGSDCLGVLRGVWRELLECEPEVVPAYSVDWSEPGGDEALWQALARHMAARPLEDEAPGDVILFRMRDGSMAKHLGIQTRIRARAAFVHAYWAHGVTETSLSGPWRRRIVARFAFPLTVEGDA